MKPSRLLDPADRLRLECAVLAAEQGTAGELVVVVVAASDAYASAPWRLGVLLALIACLGAAIFLPDASVLALLAAQAAGLAAAFGLARLDPVRRRLVSDALAEARVRERAERAFAEHGLARTAGRTGVLLFVSLLERRVRVLADEGVHSRLGPGQSWQEVVDQALEGLRGGRAAEGLLRAVRTTGAILARHLPAPPRNPDELPTALVLEDRPSA